MTVTVYKSTDTSAPSLTGQAGKLTDLLDAILVNGYGSKASQGWSIAYTGTNKRAYRQPVGSNQRYLRVDDTAAGSAAYARVVGYESMSAIDTGTNAFPTDRQFSGGLYCQKSSTADATARPWYAYGNGKFLHLFIACDSSLIVPVTGGFQFGDFTSYTPGDTYNTLLFAGNSTSNAVNNTTNVWQLMAQGYFGPSLAGCYLCRACTGIGGAITSYFFTNAGLAGYFNSSGSTVVVPGHNTNASGTNIATMPPYPNPADGGLLMERFWIVDGGAGGIRGEIPGIWCPMHFIPLSHLDTFVGSGLHSGKTFEAYRGIYAAGSWERFLETSDTW